MQPMLRPCAWVDRATLVPCPVANPAYRMLVTTATVDEVLLICTDHLSAAVVASFAAYGVEALYVERAHRAPAA